MSNIFYSEVDKNLQIELDERGRSGFYDRSERALNFMLGKIANVECTAYSGNNSGTDVVGVLGGAQMQTGRFMPSGKDGYLTNPEISQDTISYWTQTDKHRNPDDKDIIVGNAYVRKHSFKDSSSRTGPYILSADVQIGDHSMGLMNTATIRLVIPNPQRDLDEMEQIWFRPGRYMKIQISYPDSAIVSKNITGGYLDPKKEKFWTAMQTIYPKLKLKKKGKDRKSFWKMNDFEFEGLMINFDFQYTQDGTVEATLSLRGTSLVYTDVSMFTPVTNENQNPQKSVNINDIKTNAPAQFFGTLHDYIKNITEKFQKENHLQNNENFLAPFALAHYDIPDINTGTAISIDPTDQFILYGEPYENSTTFRDKPLLAAKTNLARYITLGALTEFINQFVLTRLGGSVENPLIVCNDSAVISNYYESLVSTDPVNILLLPGNVNLPMMLNSNKQGTQAPDCNVYGELVFYPTNKIFTKKPWPGVYKKSETGGKLYPSRIFINIEWIQSIIQSLSEKSTKDFTVATFYATISSKIEKATAGAIKLRLVTNPNDPEMLIFSDANFIHEPNPKSTANVIPYSIPMFSNHPNGTIAEGFNLSAKMPDNLKNLSYVLNEGKDISESQIAPYMNFMFNAQNVAQINKLANEFRETNKKAVDNLIKAKYQFGRSPGVEEHQQALYKALAEYIKYPHDDWRRAQQMTAPLYPFEASVTIDGIQGFRYGDVVQFDVLPMRYRRNTVFSIMGITHTVSETGKWTTELKCMMRPSIE